MVDSKEFKDLLNKINKNEEIKRIYVCSPLSAKTKQGIAFNALVCKDRCNALNGILKNTGIKIWAAHGVLPQILDDDILEERKLAIDFGMRLLQLSQAVYVFGPHFSKGMREEIRYAVLHNMPVLIDSEDLYNEIRFFADSIITKGGEINAGINNRYEHIYCL